MEALDRSQFELFTACFRDDGPLRQRYEQAGIPVVLFKVTQALGPGAFKGGRLFRQFIQTNGIDIIHAHDRYSNMFAVPWARSAGITTIASKRWDSISTVHGIANQIVYRMADRVLANSEAIGRSLTEKDFVPANKIVVIPNFADPEAFDPPSETWIRQTRSEFQIEHGPVVGIIANLRPIKDHETLLHALRDLRDIRGLTLVCVGTGEREAHLRALADELGISKMVRFVGYKPNRPNLHWLFDVSVLCSRSEGSPNSLIEAMAAARPVVATRVGGIPDVVIDGLTGTLCAPGSPAQLAGALRQVLQNRELRMSMGLAGLSRARSLFSAKAAIDALSQLYKRLYLADRPAS
jgi:glycosyltransferase involved in cell wall biosynthesis